MKVHSFDFLASHSRVSQCLKDDVQEYAFIGRSNVGKSSLINMIAGRKSIAKVSSTPGKTQLINSFLLNEKLRIIDLPGYGYAKVSKKHRASLRKMIENYLLNRENLVCTFLLLDSRIKLQAVDEAFMSFLGKNGVPFVIVFTKIDGIRKQTAEEQVQSINESILKSWSSLPQQFLTSSRKGIGKEEILHFIGELYNN